MSKKRTRPTRSAAPRRGTKTPTAATARARAPLSKLSPQQRGAITRAAKRDGKDPARVLAGLKAAETRQRNERAAQRRERQRKAVSARSERPSTPKGTHTKPRADRRQRSKRVTDRKRKRRVLPKRTQKAPRPRSEYAVSADYKSKRGKAVTIQIAAIGPPKASRQDAIDAVDHKINTGNSPRGWTVRIINWRGGEWRGEPIEQSEQKKAAWHTLSAPLALADLDVSKVGRD